MSEVLENLFTLAGVGTPGPGLPPGGLIEAMISSMEQSIPPHPAAELQADYLAAIAANEQLQRDLTKANAASGNVGLGCKWSTDDIDFMEIHRRAIKFTLDRFRTTCFRNEAKLDVNTEFQEIFGEELSGLIYESGNYRYRDLRDRGKSTDPREIRLDMMRFWDGLANKYADGGIRLARSQAAHQIITEWRLQHTPFTVVNGKAMIEDCVYTEEVGSYRGGGREVSYSCHSSLFMLMKALDVFFDFADLNGSAESVLAQNFVHSWKVRSGTRYVVVPGHVEFRTFNAAWKWTLSASAAERLREFIAEYGLK